MCTAQRRTENHSQMKSVSKGHTSGSLEFILNWESETLLLQVNLHSQGHLKSQCGLFHIESYEISKKKRPVE